MTTSLAKRVHYERHKNGVDMYVLKTSVTDVVSCMMAFPGGVYSTYERRTIAALLGQLLPGATKTKTRSLVLEQFEALGAQVAVQVDMEHLTVTLAARKAVFDDAFRLAMQVLTTPKFTASAFHEGQVAVENSLLHAREDTRFQTQSTVRRTLFRRGHPHWVPELQTMLRELKTVDRKEVLDFHRKTFSSIGALVCVAGDIVPKRMMDLLRRELSILPTQKPSLLPKVQVGKVGVPDRKDSIVSMHDKINIDATLAIPLSLTHEHADWHALQLGVFVLGGSATSRLFYTLRTKMSLTYGAYGSLIGFADGYTGYLAASAIFPQEYFVRGRKALRNVVREFLKKGVTSQELSDRKDEIVGKHKVGLSTTSGMCGSLFATLLSGRPVSYIDEYPDMVCSLTLGEVNAAIKKNVDYKLAVSASAGAVDQDGKPLS